MNPIVTIYMKNGARIVLELLPEAAPNTVRSFLYAVSTGCMNGHAIERLLGRSAAGI